MLTQPAMIRFSRPEMQSAPGSPTRADSCTESLRNRKIEFPTRYRSKKKKGTRLKSNASIAIWHFKFRVLLPNSCGICAKYGTRWIAETSQRFINQPRILITARSVLLDRLEARFQRSKKSSKGSRMKSVALGALKYRAAASRSFCRYLHGLASIPRRTRK